jgi:hypothetical protein
MTVDGVAVAVNTAQPNSPQTLSAWAPFVLTSVVRSGSSVRLAEMVKAVPLTPEAFKSPWRWDFGDGSAPGRGSAVRHTYRHPGVYRVTVSAYYLSHKLWYTFDAAQVRVMNA